jgi:predicted Zn-dependent peptidase
VNFDVRRDPALGEEVWLGRTRHGLRLRLVPTDRFREAVGVVSVGYGSTDLSFTDDGGRHTSPEGVAHYLEHKLFEDEALHTFDRFARRGAQVNAVTSFTRTSYWFAATSGFADNLSDLLRLVARPHITPANVDKERGIIAQEIKSYEDAPGYRAFFDLLRCLYGEHPVRHPVAGTVESIQGITEAELLRCHAAFYRTGNAVLAAAGPIDAGAVAELAEACALPAGPALPSSCPEDLGRPPQARSERVLPVARARVLVGCKERSLVPDGEARMQRQLATVLLLDLMFAPSSPLRERLARDGIADDSLTYSAMAERTFGFVVVGGESEDPARLEAELRAAVGRPLLVAEADLARAKRKVFGHYVRGFESARALAFGHAEQELNGVPPFRLHGMLEGLTAATLAARQRELFAPDALASATVRPAAAAAVG